MYKALVENYVQKTAAEIGYGYIDRLDMRLLNDYNASTPPPPQNLPMCL